MDAFHFQAHAQFEADIAGLDSGAKSDKEDVSLPADIADRRFFFQTSPLFFIVQEFIQTVTAIDAQYGSKISSLHKLHMEKMDGMFEQKRGETLQSFIDAVKDKKPRVCEYTTWSH